eukprot:6994-Pelagomonas_calceolata.AAC.3
MDDIRFPTPLHVLIEFEDWRDAERAMGALDGYDFFGSRIVHSNAECPGFSGFSRQMVVIFAQQIELKGDMV